MKDSIMLRDKYIDQVALRYSPFPVQAQIVHHIFPRDCFPEYEWMSWNLVSVSRATHNRLHDRETDRLTDEGIALLKRTAKKQKISLDGAMERLFEDPPRSKKIFESSSDGDGSALPSPRAIFDERVH
jgi:hypothetical protein